MSYKKQTHDHTKEPAAPAVAARKVKEIPMEDRLPEEFRPLYLWWKSNGNFCVTALAVLCLLYAGHKWYKGKCAREAADIGHVLRNTANATGQARVDALATLAAKHGSSRAGRHAQLLLGKALHDDERFEEALAAYAKYLSKDSKSEFADIARAGEAASLEALGRADEAMAKYSAFLEKAPQDHYLRPEVEMGVARCVMLKGDKTAALQKLEETEARYANTEWANRIEQMKGVIERYEPRAPRKRLSLAERLERQSPMFPAATTEPGMFNIELDDGADEGGDEPADEPEAAAEPEADPVES